MPIQLGLMSSLFYLTIAGESKFAETKQRCHTYDLLGSTVAKIDCTKHIITYSLAAITSFIAPFLLTRHVFSKP